MSRYPSDHMLYAVHLCVLHVAVNCGEPATQTGYMISSGASTYQSTRTVECAIGYQGSPSALTCQSTRSWTTSAGCSIRDCGTPVAVTGYVVGTGSATTYGATYSMTCDTGYSGAAASLTCQSDGSWSTQSGCTLIANYCSSSPTQANYVIATGTQSMGATRTVSCATGY